MAAEARQFPACCYPRIGASYGEIMYCAYNVNGAKETAGKSFDGRDCPVWAEQDENVKAKWATAASYIIAVYNSDTDAFYKDAGKLAYESYNAGGHHTTFWKTVKGFDCPPWDQLPENTQHKWKASALHVVTQMIMRTEINK